jgi:amino acid adenylation domain-containing protein
MADCRQSIPSRFAALVRYRPEALAVKAGGAWLSYAQLDRLSNRVAHAILSQRGPGEEAVALLLDKGVDFVAAFLGILKAGKIVVPLDASYPAARTRFMVEDSGARLIVCDVSPPPDAVPPGVMPLALRAVGSDDGDLTLPLGAGSGAVILYTSGSTGQPKGVVWDHRSLLHTTMTYCQAVTVSMADRVALIFSGSAFGGMRDIMAALLNGATLLPFDVRTQGVAALADWIEAERVSVVNIGVTAFRHLVGVLVPDRCLRAPRALRVGGETMAAPDALAAWHHFPPPCCLHFAFGTTETGNATEMIFPRGAEFPGRGAPTGYPVHGMEVLILDGAGKPVAPGEQGEIAIRSRYFPPGYWRRPDLTERAYTPDPSADGTRLYRTGDVGYLDDRDGCLVHLGRLDAQVKIRGYRVDPGEVEAVLLAQPGVTHAAVVALERAPGDRRLVAYVAPAGTPGVAAPELRRALAERLPTHLVPSILVALPALPSTPQGKIDRRALPPPDWSGAAVTQPYVAPRTPLETEVAALWAEVLGLDRVGVTESFLDLGGDSLLATRLAARVIERFRLPLAIFRLLGAGTVEEMSLQLLATLAECDGAGAIIDTPPDA